MIGATQTEIERRAEAQWHRYPLNAQQGRDLLLRVEIWLARFWAEAMYEQQPLDDNCRQWSAEEWWTHRSAWLDRAFGERAWSAAFKSIRKLEGKSC